MSSTESKNYFEDALNKTVTQEGGVLSRKRVLKKSPAKKPSVKRVIRKGGFADDGLDLEGIAKSQMEDTVQEGGSLSRKGAKKPTAKKSPAKKPSAKRVIRKGGFADDGLDLEGIAKSQMEDTVQEGGSLSRKGARKPSHKKKSQGKKKGGFENYMFDIDEIDSQQEGGGKKKTRKSCLRKPSKYNLFMKKRMAEMKKSHPKLSNPEKFKKIAAEWRAQKH